MLKLIILILIICFIYYLITNKIKINIPSFFRKGIKLQKGAFGVYCYCGKQGSSKTMNVIRYLRDHSNNFEKIYCNMKSIDQNCINYEYIEGLEGLLALRKEHDCIIFFDEIFTEINKHQRIGKDVMDFLSQMRKRRIILITTCQEWRLLPLDFRLYVRYQVNCSMKSLPLINAISIKKIIDGDNIKWSDEEQDFVGELIETNVWHCEKEVCDMYDTYEQIGKFANYSITNDMQNTNNNDTEQMQTSTCAQESQQVDLHFWNDFENEDILENEEEEN